MPPFIERIRKRVHGSGQDASRPRTGLLKHEDGPDTNFLGVQAPLYTTQLGKNGAEAIGVVRGLVQESGRVIRDRFLRNTLQMDANPEITVIDKKGLKVALKVPLRLLSTTGTFGERVRRARDKYVKSGQWDLAARIPPAEKITTEDERAIAVIPTPSYPAGPFQRHIGAEWRHRNLARANPDWPMATVLFRATGQETGFQLVKERGHRITPTEAGAHSLLPNLDMRITLRYPDPASGHAKNVEVNIPLSEASLRFSKDGTLAESAYHVGKKFFHPSLISLRDFAEVVSAHLASVSHGEATVDSDTLLKSFKLAPGADEDTREIIEAHLTRMEDVGRINQLLFKFPGSFLKAFGNTVRFTDVQGNPSPNAELMMTEIMGSILGLEDSPFPADHPTNYLDFVELVSKIVAQPRYAGTFLMWAGNGRVIEQAVATAQNMPELYTLVQKMGVKDPEEMVDIRHVMGIAEFFTQARTPSNLLANAIAVWELENAMSELMRHVSEKESARIQLAMHVVRVSTKIDLQKLVAARKTFDEGVKQLGDGTVPGQAMGQAVVQAVREHYFDDKEEGPDVIDAEVSENPPEK